MYPLEPLNTIVPWCLRGFRGDLNLTPMWPSLSDGWTPDGFSLFIYFIINLFIYNSFIYVQMHSGPAWCILYINCSVLQKIILKNNSNIIMEFHSEKNLISINFHLKKSLPKFHFWNKFEGSEGILSEIMLKKHSPEFHFC